MNSISLDAPIELRIEQLDSHGRGIASVDGKLMLCDGALPDEVVRVSQYRQRRNLLVAQAYSVTKPCEARIPPLCRYFGECGGCQLQHAHYDAQLTYKETFLQRSLLQYGDVTPEQWLSALANAPFHYRRRVRLGVRAFDNGEVIIGFHRKSSSYLLDILVCPVLDPRLHMLLEPLHLLVKQLSVRHRLPQIEMSCSEQKVAVVFRHLVPLSENDRVLLQDFADLHEVLVFTQAGGPESFQPLLKEQVTTLQYSFPRHQVRLTFAATDFIQANAQINQQLVDAVLTQLDVQEQDVMLDLFCGIGNFSLPAARYVHSVIGIESHPALVGRARKNAAHNGLRNAHFQQTDLDDWSPDTAFNKLLIDPPREGAIEVIKRLSEEMPETIVYVSCLPKTLARDARYLVHRLGYTLSKAGIVDMFPQTRHVEAIAVFQR